MKHNAQQSRKEGIMTKNKQALEASTSRRSFLQKGVVIGGAGTIGAGLLSAGLLNTNFAHAHGTASSAITKVTWPYSGSWLRPKSSKPI